MKYIVAHFETLILTLTSNGRFYLNIFHIHIMFTRKKSTIKQGKSHVNNLTM